MASRGKKKTTAAKLNREGKLRERRAEKQIKKGQRRAEADRLRLGGEPLEAEPQPEPLPPAE
ncbi:MAG TPA: hypothetical protein VG223_10115 [Solirubrobacteraceae bacterium]|jgi:hypothetical protein|nr:hypothetical protein [Solirubrobacteraceae bacterium]